MIIWYALLEFIQSFLKSSVFIEKNYRYKKTV